MTKKELIELLAPFNDDLEVMFDNDMLLRPVSIVKQRKFHNVSKGGTNEYIVLYPSIQCYIDSLPVTAH